MVDRVVCVTVLYTEASLRARNDRNVLYERIGDTLISHKRYDTYIWSAPLEALDLTSESLHWRQPKLAAPATPSVDEKNPAETRVPNPE